MSIFSKVLLSGSTNGRPISATATATPGTAVHTAVTGTSDIDEVWLYATNTSAADVVLTVEFGGVTSPGDLIVVTVPAKSTTLVVPGVCLQNGLAIKAFAGTTAVLNVFGHVNRITA